MDLNGVKSIGVEREQMMGAFAMKDWEHTWKQCETVVIEAARRLGLPKRDVGILKHTGNSKLRAERKHLGMTRACAKILLASVPKLRWLSISLPFGNDFLDFKFDREQTQAGTCSYLSNLEGVSFFCEFNPEAYAITTRSLSPILGFPGAKKLTLRVDGGYRLRQIVEPDVTCPENASTITDLTLLNYHRRLPMTILDSLLQMPRNLTSLVLQFGLCYRDIGGRLPRLKDHATNSAIWHLLTERCSNLELVDYHNSSEADFDTSIFGSLTAFSRLQSLQIQLQTLGIGAKNDVSDQDFATSTFPTTLQSLALYIHGDDTWNGLSAASTGIVIS